MTEEEPQEKHPLPDEDESLAERLKEWAGETTDPPEAVDYDTAKTNPVTGQQRTP